MYRILFTAALLALAPACVNAQAATPKPGTDSAAQATPRKSHNAFSDAIRELTRVAQEQAANEKAAHAAAPAVATARRDATAKNAAPPAIPATAPVLADSNLP